MQSRSTRSQRPSLAAAGARANTSTRAPSSASTRAPSSSSTRAPSSTSTRTSATPATRPGHGRSSSLRQPLNHHAAIAARIDRTAAPSPADSLASSAAAVGGKRKERDFDVDPREETNINVVVRCRGRNEREVRENSAVVVETEGAQGKLVELSMGPSALSNKTYNFDRVFSQAADQRMIYDDVVNPILEEMLGGFNCTIFAYGQTGTGKTYTMSGDMNETLGLLSDEAGIIPRVLHSLFKRLEADETESLVRCSFIELYNEELRDLITGEENTKLKIYDDTSKRGHSTTMVQGMEESYIKSASDGIRILQSGSLKRQVAATKCNDLSSRSHTIFTITVATKRKGEDGEDYVSAGKLNLVDLAGSENIQRSGAENKRAAEAGLINKSLLTLGRVINALVDRNAHIPYRESKLTRLLQDSLGGRTKTCIIATVSPAKSNLEETISTLDYAFRAKNIRNMPQMNQMINKKTLLREFAHEIERLKSELIATRQRNGVYLSNESYEDMTQTSESRRIQNEEQAAKIENIESNLRNKVQELFSLTSNFMGLKKDHEATRSQLDNTRGVLDQTELVLGATRKMLSEETQLRQAHEKTEDELHAIGGQLISTLRQTVDHVGGLRKKNKRKSDLQSTNRDNWSTAQTHVSDVTSTVENRIETFRGEQAQHIVAIADRMQSFVEGELQKLASTQAFLDQNLERFTQSKTELMEQKESSKSEMDEVLEEIKLVRDDIKDKVGDSLQSIASAAERISQDVLSELNTFHGQLHQSYESLGRDFKATFDDLQQHIETQRQESNSLRSDLQAAGETLVRHNEAVAARVRDVVSEERQHAARERQTLLAQITALVNAQADVQESRWAERTAALQKDVGDGNSAYQGRVAQYDAGMDAWCEREDEFVSEVTQSRTALKAKLEEDWVMAEQHSTSIQNTTRSVHAETVRVVDEQMRHLQDKMASLDDFVTRARSENASHHERHTTAVAGLDATVHESYNAIGEHFDTTFSRVQDLGTNIAEDVSAAADALEPLPSDTCAPLAALRDHIDATALEEYQPTGETPQKTAWDYPTDLPRTRTREVLAASRPNHASPSKRQNQVFCDADSPLKENRSPVRPYASEQCFPPLGRSLKLGLPAPNLGGGLREMSPNVSTTTAAATGPGPGAGGHATNTISNLDPRANATFHGFSASAADKKNAINSIVSNQSRDDGAMPPLKKSRIGMMPPHATSTTGHVYAKKPAAVAEGRENMPPMFTKDDGLDTTTTALAAVLPGHGPEVFSQSVSRRKSPRLN